MDLFEIVFILLFILFPILEGIGRRRRGGTTKQKPPQPRPPDRAQAPSTDRESAADMVPDELWGVLTGERRTTPSSPEPEAGEDDAPWSVQPWEEEPASEPDDPGAPWAVPEPATRDGSDDTAIVSAEYLGPEAYSLERTDFEPVSSEQPIPSPDVRHRRFHERLERSRVRPVRRRRGIARALADPEDVRRAVVLSEILGPPRGLRP